MYQRERAGSQDKRLLCPSDPCLHRTCPHWQPADTSSVGGGGGGCGPPWLRGIVPRMENVGIGNHIKGLGLFINLCTSDQQTAEPEGCSRSVEALEQ